MVWSWRVLLSINNEKTNRHFKSWVSERMNKTDAEGYRISNGVIFSLALSGFGFVLLLIGSLQLFGFIKLNI